MSQNPPRGRKYRGAYHGGLVQVQIPAQSDWTEMGDVILPGQSGSWDARLDGSITPCTVVKKDGTYFLYYVGADGDRSSGGGPRNRTLGVATSSNGIDFTKYAGNPVIQLPRGNVNPEEEGAFNCGATQDDSGNVVMYWEQNVGTGSSSVSAHVQLAISPDGFTFTDLGPVFDHRDATWRAGGDEVGPTGAFERDGTWYVFLVIDGHWELGIAWGPSMDSLVNTAPLLTGSGADVRGGGDPVFIGPDTIALFLSRGSGAREIDVRTTSPDTPDSQRLIASSMRCSASS